MKLKDTCQRLADAAARLAQEHPKHAHLFSPEKRLTPDGKIKCCIVTCDRPLYALGLCAQHYHRQYCCQCGLNPNKPIKRGRDGNGRWRGGQISDGHGRILIYAPEHPNPSFLGTYIYRYRLVVEKHLGRFLLPSEIVHHKNGIIDDDRLENIEVMTQAEHAKSHDKERVRNKAGQYA